MYTHIPSIYLMNNIPRGTSSTDLLCSLAEHWKAHNTSVTNYPLLVQMMEREPIIQDSQLDDDLSVAMIEFKLGSTPRWFQMLERDPNGFPKVSVLGTLWRGVDMTALDQDGRNAFCIAAISGNVLLAETLAEFPQTDVNVPDRNGRTALHWSCINRDQDMIAFLLALPGLDTGVRDVNGLTALDISCEYINPDPTMDAITTDTNEAIATLFFKSILKIAKSDPHRALLRMLTVTSDPDECAVFPGKALFGPVVANNLSLVQALMESGVDLTATTKDRETALHLAAKEGHAEIVNALLANPSRGKMFDVEAVAKDGLTALHYAADGGHRETVQELLRYGAGFTAEDDLGLTAFDRAVEKQHFTVQQILKQAETEVEILPSARDTTERARTPNAALDRESPLVRHSSELNQVLTGNVDHGLNTLYSAAGAGRIDIMRRMLDDGADIEGNGHATDCNGCRTRTPLHAAISAGQYDASLLLLDRGANIEATCCLLIRYDFQSRMESGTWTALHHASNVGNDPIVQLLLERGARIQASGTDRITALHLASGIGHQPIINRLLDCGAAVDAVDNRGWTALCTAANLGQLETARLLLSRGAAVGSESARGRLALFLASQSGNKEIVQLLLDGGAAIDTVDSEGLTALHAAAQYNRPEVIQLLLDQGAAIDTQDHKGLTALHSAIIWHRGDVVQLLVNRGAALELPDIRGWTALHSAVCHSSYEIVQLLLNRGANILARTGDGKLPMDLSSTRYHEAALPKRAGWGGLRTRTKRFLSNLISSD